LGCAVFVGLATVDLIYEVEALPRENEKGVARRQEILCGGPAANAAITCAFLGAPVKFAGVIGRHPLTSVIRNEFGRFGVTVHDVAPDSKETPSLSSIFVNQSTGSRTIVSGHATREQFPASAFDGAWLDGAGLLMADGHQMSCAIAATAEAKKKGLTVMLDGGSWKDGTEELLAQTDVAICSEAFRPPGTQTLADVVDYLLVGGVRHAAITRGGDSILWASGSERGEIAVPRITAVDTLGAGDIFHGAFCRRMLDGAGFVDALSFAAEVASYSCRFFGTRTWMQKWRGY
jgi:sugar/nucleoside kinase (ribokinase family)